MKLVVWSYLEEGVAVARRLLSDFEVEVVKERSNLEAALHGAAGLVLENSRYDADVARWAAAGGVRWIQLLSAGYENVERFGLPSSAILTTATGARSATVAEHGLALVLALLHAVPHTLRAMQAREWQPNIARQVRSLYGMTALVVGYGSIGREIGLRMRAFGVDVMAANRSPVDHPSISCAYTLDALDDALPLADIVAVSVAHTPATHHLIDARRLTFMKPGAMLLNVARGGIVDTDALVVALGSRRLGGAVLDVTDPEPLPGDHPLWSAPNTIISPHLGGTATPASTVQLADLVHDNAWRLRRGEPLASTVSI